uniref:RING-type domain-containing protein n=1 Tax=Hyaloperonospora arabidopsidis (strain Emoy2) TaxID=559515 RepID=M4BFQ8_HYAAE
MAHCTGLGMAQSLSFFSSLRKSDSDENDDGANACAICLETMKGELATLSCGHVFHYTCVKRALAGCPACPVCRRKASPRNAIRLYLLVEARQKRSCKCKHRSHSTRQACREEALHNVLARSASELPERMKKMRVELDRINEIQRMTSSHSFQLENELARRQQQQEQTMRQMQHVQCELDRANVKLKRLQRIATSSYSQCREAKHANVEFKRHVQTTADRLLELMRGCRRSCCPGCTTKWAEMKRVVQELAAPSGAGLCCTRHVRRGGIADVDERIARHHCHLGSCQNV